MQQTFLIVLLVLLIAACSSEDKGSFTVSGVLHNPPSKVVLIEETNIATGVKSVKDSADIGSDGKFSLKVKAGEESIYNIRMENDHSPFSTINKDASKINIESD